MTLEGRAARNIYKNVFYETNRTSMLNSKNTLAVMILLLYNSYSRSLIVILQNIRYR